MSNKNKYQLSSYEIIRSFVVEDKENNLFSAGARDKKLKKWFGDLLPETKSLETEDEDFDDDDDLEIGVENETTRKKQFQSQKLQDKIIINALFDEMFNYCEKELKINRNQVLKKPFESSNELSLPLLIQQSKNLQVPLIIPNVRFKIDSNLAFVNNQIMVDENKNHKENSIEINLNFPSIIIIPPKMPGDKPTLKIFSIMNDRIVRKDILTKLIERELLTNFGEDFSKHFNIEFTWAHPNKYLSSDKFCDLRFFFTNKISLSKSKSSSETTNARHESKVDKIIPDINEFFKNPKRTILEFKEQVDNYIERTSNELKLEQRKTNVDEKRVEELSKFIKTAKNYKNILIPDVKVSHADKVDETLIDEPNPQFLTKNGLDINSTLQDFKTKLVDPKLFKLEIVKNLNLMTAIKEKIKKGDNSLFLPQEKINTNGVSQDTNLSGINVDVAQLFDWMAHNFLIKDKDGKLTPKMKNLIWFDFETVNLPFTIIENVSKPYSTLPVQNSIQLTSDNNITYRKNHLYVGKMNNQNNNLTQYNINSFIKVWKDLLEPIIENDGSDWKLKPNTEFVVYSSFEQARVKEAIALLEIYSNYLINNGGSKEEIEEIDILQDQLESIQDLFIDLAQATKSNRKIFDFKDLSNTSNGVSIKKLQPYINHFMPELLEQLDVIQDRSQMKIHNGAEATEVLQILTMLPKFGFYNKIIADQLSKDDLENIKNDLKIYCQNDVSIMMLVYNWFQRILSLPEFQQEIVHNSESFKKLNSSAILPKDIFKPIIFNKNVKKMSIKK